MEKVDFIDQFYLKLQLKPPDFTRNYGVLYTFNNGNDTHTVKFNLNVTYIKTIVNRARIFKLDRTTPIYVNNVEPDLLADQLAYECGKIFYPLMVEIDFDGKFMCVHNYNEIMSRWKEKRISVGEYFKGEMTEKYLQLMDEAIASPEQVTEMFANELFISAYFFSLYKSYGLEFTIEEHCNFPIAGKAAAVRFETFQVVDQNLNEANKIEVIHHGKINDERTIRDLKEESSYPISKYTYTEESHATGTYTALYRLDAETKSIYSIVADWVVAIEPIQKTQLKVFELVQEMVDQENAKQQNEGSTGMFFIDGHHEKSEISITSIFNFLLGK
ncbi:hypothetical protein [Pedobacter sp. L105]|uniref:hypothetical protein n=1 Tax=Pedobacter sp. L105 TaxID=1641871 RepID=UPI00131D0D93|nr:hypothetical protein [Pedobacter sp. L105]